MVDRMSKEWELRVAQELLNIRLALQKDDILRREEDNRRLNLPVRASKFWHGKFTQTAVARRVGVSNVTLHNWEYGHRVPVSWELWEKWANALGHEFDVILRKKRNEKEQISLNIQRNFK